MAQSVTLPGFVSNLELSICVYPYFLDKPCVAELTLLLIGYWKTIEFDIG